MRPLPPFSYLVFFLHLHMHVPLCLHCALLWNISDDAASAIYLLVSFVVSTRAKVYSTCSCVSSFMTAAWPSSLKLLSPIFSADCVMMRWSMWFLLSSLVIFGVITSLFRWICMMLWDLPVRLVIIMVDFPPFLVEYPPECSAIGSPSYSYMIPISFLSLSSLYIYIGYGVSFSDVSTSLTLSSSSA